MNKISLVSLVVAAVLSLFAIPAFATNFCDDNPGHVTCPGGQQPTTATATGGTAQSDADSRAAAAAIAGALAANDISTVQRVWSSLSAAQQTQVTSMMQLTNDQRNQFQGAVTGILRTGDANFSGLGSGNATNVTLVNKNKGNVTPSGNTVAGADGKVGEMREGDCGPLLDLTGWKVFENYTVSYTLGGLFPVRDLVRTAVGSFSDGIPKFDRKQKYRVEIHNLDVSEIAEHGNDYVQGWTRYGHKLTKISSVVGNSGSSKATLHRGESGNTADVANAGAGGIPQHGYMVEECPVKDGLVKRPPVAVTGTIPPMVPLSDLQRLEEQRTALALRLDELQRQKAAAKPADDSDILVVREKVMVPPKGVTYRVGDACRLPGAKCEKVAATPGSVTEREYAIDCRAPKSESEASRCANRKAKVGQPPIERTEVVEATR